MTNKWIKPLSKAAGITDAGVYYIMKKAGRSAPYSEYEVLTALRAKGRKCKGYKPTADAVGKPLPPVGEKTAQGSLTKKRLVNRAAKLLSGGDNVNNKTRIRNWFKKAGYTDYKSMTDEEALKVLEDKGVDTSKFEYATGPATSLESVTPSPSVGNGSGALLEEPAGSRRELIAQYTAIQNKLRAAMETVEQVNATMAEKDKKIAALVKKKSTVRDMLRQYESQILDVAKRHFGSELRRPLTFPIHALDEIRED